MSAPAEVLITMARMMLYTRRMMRRAKNSPPHMVKSILVWMANRVKPRVTAAVMPTAIRRAEDDDIDKEII